MVGVLIHGWSESDPIGRTAAWLPSPICDQIDLFGTDVRLLPHLTRFRQTEVVKGLQPATITTVKQECTLASPKERWWVAAAYPHRSLATKETVYATWACNSTLLTSITPGG